MKFKKQFFSNDKVIFVFVLSLVFLIGFFPSLEKENTRLITVPGLPRGSLPPVDEDFEVYVPGTSISGQGNWIALVQGSCGATVQDRSGDNWLSVVDINGMVPAKVEAAMAFSSGSQQNGFATFTFECTDVTKEANFFLSDGPWSEFSATLPNGSCHVRARNQLSVMDGSTWRNVRALTSNTKYVVEFHFDIAKGWHLVVNGTKYSNGGDYTYQFEFGTPTAMNVFEVTTSSADTGYTTYIDNIDASWTPNDFDPVLSSGYVEPAVGTNVTTSFTYTVNYTDPDNNAPVYVNMIIDQSTIVPMVKETGTDINYSDGCIYTCTVGLYPGNHSYMFNCSDGLRTSSLGPFFGPYSEPQWNAVRVDGIRIGCMISHGESNPRIAYATIAGDFTTRGANITDITVSITDAVLANYDIVWVYEGGATQITTAELDALQTWTRAGGRVLVTGDDTTSTHTERLVINKFSIYLYSRSTLTGTSTSIYPHPITRNVAGVYFSTTAYLSIYNQPAAVHCVDFNTYVQVVGMEYGDGKVVIVSDDTVFSSYSQASNRLFANNVLGWLGYELPNTFTPSLAAGTVSPNTGNQSTPYTFQVRYTDADNNEPDYVRVVVGSVPYDMLKENPYDFNYSDGCYYTRTVYLQPGIYTHEFTCSDGTHVVTTMPSLGPAVSLTNVVAPALSHASLFPNRGYNGTTVFNFSVTYTDLDNNAPSFINVTLNSTQVEISKLDPADEDYMDGCTYVLGMKIATPGNYTYAFNASDGSNPCGAGPFPGLEVEPFEPSFFDGMVYNWTGYFNWTNSHEDGSEVFTAINPTQFSVTTTPGGSIRGNRVVNVTSRVITDCMDYGWYTHEWTRIPIDMGIGSTILVTVAQMGDQVFTVARDELFVAMNRSFVCWVLESPEGSMLYYDKYSGALVNGTFFSWWRYYTIQLTGTNIPLHYINQNAPVLSGDVVTPGSGSSATLFTFSVTYEDVDGNGPVIMAVLVDGIPFEMLQTDPNDTDASDGLQFEYSTYLQPDPHEFSFYCSDGVYSQATSPITGPAVGLQNLTPPSLVNASLSPLAGYNGSTIFEFSVTYVDADNNAPSFVNVTINGSSIVMEKAMPSDMNYMDGCVFLTRVPLDATGVYVHSFDASDGGSVIGTGPIPGPQVIETHVRFFDELLYEWDGSFLQMGGGSGWFAQSGRELFNQTGPDEFFVDSYPEYMYMGDRTINGTTGLVSPGFFPPYSIEWVMIDTDMTVGANISLAVFNTMSLKNFMVTGETIFTAMGIAFNCLVLESGAGDIAYYDKYSGLLINGTFYPGGMGLDAYTIQVRGTNVPLKPNIHAPVLSGDSFSPGTGDPLTGFTFNVTYTDLDNDVPEFIDLVINGTRVPAQKTDIDDGDYTDGCDYFAFLYLQPGTYLFSFEASDYVHVIGTSQGAGPAVSPSNTGGPILVDRKVVPTYGFNGSTSFTFSVIYSDADNNAPEFMNLVLNGTIFSMIKADPFDSNYADGMAYTLALVLADTGTYTYSFHANDGVYDASIGPYSELDVVQQSDLFFNGMQYNWTGWFDWMMRVDNGSELFENTIGNIFYVNSTSTGSLWADRLIDGLTRVILEDYWNDFRDGTHEWVRIRTDIGLGHVVPVSVYQSPDQSFTVTGEVVVFALGRTFNCWMLESAEGSIAFYDKYSGLLVNGTFYVNPWGMTYMYSLQITGTNVPLAPNTNAPTLTSSMVTPESGDQSTSFVYSTVYTDLDNDAPQAINVTIDGTVHPMQKQNPSDNDFTDGCIYVFSTYLPPEVAHSYFILASDYLHVTPFMLTLGPSVSYSSLSSPVLTSVTVTPELGSEMTVFNFSVVYTDADNNLPSEINVTIGGIGVFPLLETDASDKNVMDGKSYHYTTTLDFGIYGHVVNAFDGIYSTSSGWMEGPEVNPLLAHNNYTIFSEDFESGLSKWEVVDGLWHVTDTGSMWPDPVHSPVHAMWYGREQFGTYETGGRTYGSMISKPIDLTITPTAYLEFFHWREADGGQDHSYVYVSTDGGLNWVLIYEEWVSPIRAWNKLVLDMTAYCGNSNVKLRFYFDTQSEWNNAFRGWLVDDIKIYSNGTGISPLLVSPPDNSFVSYGLNTFSWQSLNLTPSSPLNYSIAISNRADFTTHMFQQAGIPEDGIITSTAVNITYPAGIYYWHVRPEFGRLTSSWSVVFRFRIADISPVANFTANDTTIVEGDWVQFNFTGSDGNIPATFQWNFGDGTPVSTLRNPKHQYNTGGNFTITLIVMDQDGDSDFMTKSNFLTVIADLKPLSSFTANITNIIQGGWVQFNFTGVDGDVPASFEWDFGDGTVNETTRNPKHQFMNPGNYSITLLVTDKDGDYSMLVKTGYIHVIDLFPVANFTANITTIAVGESVQFNFTGNDGDIPVSFQWNFGDGNTNATSRDPVHAYASSGNYTVTLSVIDGDGDFDMLSKENYIIVVIDKLPVASFLANVTTLPRGSDVQFTFTGFDGDSPATFQWNFGDGPGNSTDRNPVHTYSSSGVFTVTLLVVDNDGDFSLLPKVDYIIVVDLSPVADFISNKTTVFINESIQFTFTGFDGDSPASFQWNFGDGPTNSTTRDPVHQYGASGNYTVTLLVIDGDGDFDLEIKVDFIVVLNRIPVVDFIANITTISLDDWVQFTFTGFEGDPPASFEWDFGDSSVNSTDKNPSHQFTSVGNFNITMTVVDANLDARTLTKLGYIVVVSDLLPIANFTANTTTAEVFSTVQFIFTGLDGDAPVSFEWNFGDGPGNSTARNPVHQYNVTGNYTVTLLVVDNDGDFDLMQKVAFIHIIPEDLEPVSSFTANITTTGRDKSIQFTFTGSVGDAPATFLWDFGDGGNSTSQDPVHSYSAIGLYTVSLTVWDNDGDMDVHVSIDLISIINLVPVASFHANDTVIFEGEHIQFIFDGTSGDETSYFVWAFGDGGSSNDRNPVYQFLSQGNYTVTLSILDKDFDTDSLSIPNYITVLRDLAPVANFSADLLQVVAGQAVQFTFTGSDGNAPATFEWDFHDGTFDYSRNPLHVFTTNGTFNITLVVTDWDGDLSEIEITALITVEVDVLPGASFISDKASLIAGQSVVFSFSGTEGNQPASFQWNFGDGTPNSTARDPVHVFAMHGSFTIVLTVRDVDGDEHVAVFPVPLIVVEDLEPVASFSTNVTVVFVNNWIAFTFNGTSGNEPSNITWVFGDGSIASGASVLHKYIAIGDYMFSVTVTDADGDVDQYTFVLKVNHVPDGGGNPVLEFLTENWWMLLVGIAAIIGIAGAVASSRKKSKLAAATVAKGKGKMISEYAPEKKKLTHDEILAKMKHLFVFHKVSGTCIFYQPFSMKKIDPQLISGFLSAISSFGSEFDKGAKLRVLEYEQFKILMEETEYCRHALLFEGEMDDQMRDLYNNFIYTFDTTYNTKLVSFKGEITPFKDSGTFVKEIFNAKSLPDPETGMIASSNTGAARAGGGPAVAAMEIALHCPHCNSSWPMTAEQFAMYKGKEISCTNCGKNFIP